VKFKVPRPDKRTTTLGPFGSDSIAAIDGGFLIGFEGLCQDCRAAACRQMML
jgi:hypothetical protein